MEKQGLQIALYVLASNIDLKTQIQNTNHVNNSLWLKNPLSVLIAKREGR